MSAEEMRVGNPNEVLNNYDGIIQKNLGAIDKAVQDISHLKTPTVGGGGGADAFNIVTDTIMAKAGPIGFLAELHADLGVGGGGGIDNSAFFGGGSRRPRTKRDAILAAKIRMLTTNSSSMTGKLTRQQNLALWKEVRRELSGTGVKSKNPMGGGGSGINSFTGEKTGGAKKRFPTKADLLANPNKLEQIGLGEIKQNLDTAHYQKQHRTLFEDILGTEMNWEEAKASLKTQQADEVMRVVSTTRTEEKRDLIAQDVLSAEHYLLFKMQESKAREPEQPRETQEREREEQVKLQEEEQRRQIERERELAQHAAPLMTKIPTAPEPPKPSWDKPAHTAKDDTSEKTG
jgi:hypothetical protein